MHLDTNVQEYTYYFHKHYNISYTEHYNVYSLAGIFFFFLHNISDKNK